MVSRKNLSRPPFLEITIIALILHFKFVAPETEDAHNRSSDSSLHNAIFQCYGIRNFQAKLISTKLFYENKIEMTWTLYPDLRDIAEKNKPNRSLLVYKVNQNKNSLYQNLTINMAQYCNISQLPNGTDTAACNYTYDENISECTNYTFVLGQTKKHNATVLTPGLLDGIANNVTVQIGTTVNQEHFRVPVLINWSRPRCCQQTQQTKIVGWHVCVIKDKSTVDNVTTAGTNYSVNLEVCEKYNFTIRTQLEHGSGKHVEISINTSCPPSLTGPITTLVVLFGITISVAVLLSKLKEKEGNVDEREFINIRVLAERRSNKIVTLEHRENERLDLETQITKRPLTVRDICSFDVGQAKSEFLTINKLAEVEGKEIPRTAAQRSENHNKNRFKNTHPFDFNRVILYSSDISENNYEDYINASFIPGFSGNEREYIAAQGPKDNTIQDFWRMIWEQEVRLVTMVTSLNEGGKQKCEKYWPTKGNSVSHGDIQIYLSEETEYSFYTMREITCISKSQNLKRKVKQFHFTAWPDFDIPDKPEELIRFIEIVRQEATQFSTTPAPILVHCSAGVGRTGTLIATDYLIQQVLITDHIDVPTTVSHLRRFRLSMVQSEDSSFLSGFSLPETENTSATLIYVFNEERKTHISSREIINCRYALLSPCKTVPCL